MKTCPSCHQTYTDDSQMFCLNDGTPLQTVQASPDSQATMMNVAPPRIEPGPTVSYTPNQQSYQPAPAWQQTGQAPQPARGKSVLPWIIGIIGLLLVGFVGLIVAIAVIAPRYMKENVNNANEQVNSNSLNANGAQANANSGGANQNSSNQASSSPELEQFVAKQVGPYSLTESKDNPTDYTVKDYGALGCQTGDYVSPDGRRVSFFVSKFAFNDDANTALSGFVDKATSGGSYKVANKVDVKNDRGVKTGQLVVLQNTSQDVQSGRVSGTYEYAMATNEQYFFRVYAYSRKGDALDFMKNMK